MTIVSILVTGVAVGYTIGPHHMASEYGLMMDTTSVQYWFLYGIV
jgi:hypothetical protein